MFNDVSLAPRQAVTAPGIEELVVRPILDKQRAEFISLFEEVDGPGWEIDGKHHVGGWPFLQQGPFWSEAQFGLHGVPYNQRRDNPDPAISSLDDTLDDWQLLFQLDSDDAAGWMWGDGGTLYFAIRKQDLTDRRFDQCWLTLQCG